MNDDSHDQCTQSEHCNKKQKKDEIDVSNTLKNNKLCDKDRQSQIETLLRTKISEQRFTFLVNLGKEIKDEEIQTDNFIHPHSIDPSWLQKHLSEMYSEYADRELKIQEILAILKETSNIHQLENQLILVLGYEQLDFIKTLIKLIRNNLQYNHFMSNNNCRLPDDSYRLQKDGYEEVHIPALRPKEWNPGEPLYRITSLPKYVQSAFEGYYSLNRIQTRLLKVTMESDENILLFAPNFSGKTNVAVLCILREIGKHIMADGKINIDKFKIIYVISRTCALDRFVDNFAKRFSSYELKVTKLSSDPQLSREQINKNQIIICTPDQWDKITRRGDERSFIHLIRLIIFHGIHLLHSDYGPILEAIIARTIRTIKTTRETIRLVGLGVSLSNYEDIATFLNIKRDDLFYFENNFRVAPLKQQYVGITEKKSIKQFEIMNELVYEKVMEHAGKNQVLIFVHSEKETVRTARAIRDTCLERGTIGTFIKESSASQELLQTEGEQTNNSELKDLLPYSFAVLHTGLNRPDRALVEDLFCDRHIQVLVQTITFNRFIQLPAHVVIVKGTQVYSAIEGEWTELNTLDVMAMLGYAGCFCRPCYDIRSESILITNHNQLDYYLSSMNERFSVESQMISKLIDHLNAEIVLGTIENLHEGAEWLCHTYLYVRMIKQPELYGILNTSSLIDKNLLQQRLDLIHSAAIELDKSHLIHYNRQNGHFQMTEYARIASYYYCSHKTIAIFNQLLKPTVNEIDLFRILSLSFEFQHIIVREEEKVELRKLFKCVRISVGESIDESSTKINVLLQSHISQLQVDCYTLMKDMIYIGQNAGRLMKVICEMILLRGWVQLIDKAAILAKIIDKRMW
ncbi:unnamed protein product [Adineta ricciae]|uniref:Helicase ATP-binding domain-containing protein n=1 Tax=Adineta ricciae TaxID=249248 RepID=A0A815JIA7_ADIRI|nr:unnamed protein product [Adineta ricciae]